MPETVREQITKFEQKIESLKKELTESWHSTQAQRDIELKLKDAERSLDLLWRAFLLQSKNSN